MLSMAYGGTQAAAPSAAGLEFFEKKVRPILIERCYECHSAEAGKTKGSLAVDSRDAMLRGGDNGPSLVKGDPDKSLIIEAIRYKNRDMQMPPKSAMPEAEQRILEEWVRMGAPDPRDAVAAKTGPRVINVEEGRRHWAFSPIAKPETPKADARHPVDAFITAKLAEKGLKMAPPADPATFIRRATFDLTGLPPSPEETSAFLQAVRDEESAGPPTAYPGTVAGAPKACRSLVDRLLASPHYGEKWGRHWLDVARYADSNGLDENIALGTAWRYRDYVVRAFNEDLPFDRFLTEQIAGDLLPAANLEQRRRQHTATAFLNLGAKVLAEPDKVKLVMDVVDEQIETLGRAFMGMTLGCVRCHDHKFDPISQEDYYALAAIFKSTRSFSDEKTGAISYWHETPMGGLDDFAQVKSAELALEKKKKEVAAANAAAKKTPTPELKARVDQLMTEQEAIEKNLPDLPTALGVADSAEVQPNLRVHIRGSHLTLGKPVERGFPLVMQAAHSPKASFPAKESGRLELARWLTQPDHPLTARVLVNRVWTWHFNQGLVPTPDNFGLLGTAPTHPELLDWLARWFTQEGWSIKDLHRLIMSSAAYQQRSEGSFQNADPENRLLHHFPVRRLEAEEIRDAILAASGQLDLGMGGKTVPLRNRQFVFNHTSKDATTYDSTRRALYLPIIRNNLYDLFQQFDYPDPTVSTGLRNSTVVAPQALLLMNSDLALEAAQALARRLLAVPDLADRVDLACHLAYGRKASGADHQRAQSFLTVADAALASQVEDSATREARALALYAQSLFMTNEFIYLR